MRLSWSVVFCLALVALFAGALVAAQGFRAQARLFPTVIGVVGLGFALLQLGLELRNQRMPTREAGPAIPFVSMEGAAEPEGGSLKDDLPPAVRRRRTLAILAWVLGFSVAVWLVGFSPAVPLATLAYLKFDARESWLTSSIFAAALGAVFYGVFAVALRIPFEEGALVTFILG